MPVAFFDRASETERDLNCHLMQPKHLTQLLIFLMTSKALQQGHEHLFEAVS